MNTVALCNQRDTESKLYANTGHVYSIHVNYIEMTVEIAVTNLNTKRAAMAAAGSSAIVPQPLTPRWIHHPVNSCLVSGLLANWTVIFDFWRLSVVLFILLSSRMQYEY
jgi:hypothetical protein